MTRGFHFSHCRFSKDKYRESQNMGAFTSDIHQNMYLENDQTSAPTCICVSVFVFCIVFSRCHFAVTFSSLSIRKGRKVTAKCDKFLVRFFRRRMMFHSTMFMSAFVLTLRAFSLFVPSHFSSSLSKGKYRKVTAKENC